MSHSFSGADLGGWQPPHLPRIERIGIGKSRIVSLKSRLFATRYSPFAFLQLLHLPELQFDRRRPAENAHLNFEQRVLVVNLLDGPVERRKRPLGDAHQLAHFEWR